MQHKGTVEIRTKRLLLRRYQLSDTKDMFQNYANDSEVTRFLDLEPYETEESILPFVTEVIESYRNTDMYHWAIEYEKNMIGSISVMSINELRKNCEVGYCLGAGFWNKGIMTEALEAVIRFLFDEVGMHRIMAKHNEHNPASGEVMKKCHMLYEGRLKEYYPNKDGSYSDSLMYGIVNHGSGFYEGMYFL